MKSLRIKNMVSQQCINDVEKTLKDMGYDLNDVDLGIVEFHEPINLEERLEIAKVIQAYGFEILDDKTSQLIERIKTQITELVSKEVNDLTITLSEYLSSKLQMDYQTLSDIFARQETQTIEQFYILQKIEKIKELLVYTDLSVQEIAFRMNYASAVNLTTQFKKITGLTPSFFKEIQIEKQNILKNE